MRRKKNEGRYHHRSSPFVGVAHSGVALPARRAFRRSNRPRALLRNETYDGSPMGLGIYAKRKGSAYRSLRWLVVYLSISSFQINIAQPDSVSAREANGAVTPR